MIIRERRGDGWKMTQLVSATLSRDVWSTLLNGKTHQEISDGWLDSGTKVYIHPRDVGHTSHAYAEPDELPTARDFIYDAQGMRYVIRHKDWTSICVEDGP